MKRVIYLFLMVSTVLSFTSCFGKDKYEPDPLDPGKAIFQAAYNQHSHAIEPINFAFRLNVLLNEALEQGVDITDVEALMDMQMQVGDITGSKNAFGRIFQTGETRAELESIENNIYTLYFHDDGNDPLFSRLGRMIINTGGLTLEELGLSSSWTISLQGAAGNSGFRYYEYGEEIMIAPDVEYGIFAQGEQYWEVISNEYKATSSVYNFQSSWTSNFKVTQEGNTGMTIANTYESAFFLYGSGSGVTMTGDEMMYEISDNNPIKCVPGCDPDYNKYMIESGFEEASFTGEYNIGYFPEPNCTRTWKRGTTSCTSSYVFEYDGNIGR